MAVIALGGALGSLGRWLLGSAVPPPLGTVLVNVSGAALIGLLVAWLATREHAPPLLRPFVAVGLLGGWTTYSALALDLHGLLGRPLLAVLYAAGTLALGVGACLLALRVGERVFGQPAIEGEAR